MGVDPCFRLTACGLIALVSDKKVFEYPGEKASVGWDGRLCIHVGECGRADDDLFEGGRKPWCKPDLVPLERVAEVVSRCPTGALTEIVDGKSVEEETPTANTITVANHGPLYLRGELEIAGAADDQVGLKVRAALCRCGLSENKPFCDNSHEKGGFQDRGAIGSSGSPLDSEGGPLKVGVAPDGPLLLSGNVTLVTAAGRVAWTGTKCALCRCGASKNKPFCDGSHKAAGFKG